MWLSWGLSLRATRTSSFTPLLFLIEFSIPRIHEIDFHRHGSNDVFMSGVSILKPTKKTTSISHREVASRSGGWRSSGWNHQGRGGQQAKASDPGPRHCYRATQKKSKDIRYCGEILRNSGDLTHVWQGFIHDTRTPPPNQLPSLVASPVIPLHESPLVYHTNQASPTHNRVCYPSCRRS